MQQTNMEQTTFATLLEKYLDGSITPEEKRLFIQQSEDPAKREVLEEALRQAMLTDQYLFPVPAAQTERFIEKLGSKLHPAEHRPKVVPLYRRWQAVASILLLLTAGIFIWTRYLKAPRQAALVQSQQALPDAQPGHPGAVLTLDDGRQVVLDSAANGLVATQGGTKVILNKGQLGYEAGAASKTISYNTIHTPRGRQFQLVLPDGTKVWLNAASSLRYPTAFNGNERTVEIEGEAYLEVAQMAGKPFKVSAGKRLAVQVLGTSFNVNTYEDEKDMQITLVSGKVQVSAQNASPVILLPAHQAVLQGQPEKLFVRPANTEEALAWKNGNFQFDRADIQSIMRQLSRWYDIEVVYEQLPTKKFSGTIPRDLPIRDVFSILKLTGNVGFIINGNKVTVTGS